MLIEPKVDAKMNVPNAPLLNLITKRPINYAMIPVISSEPMIANEASI